MQMSIVQTTVRRVGDNIGHYFLVNKLHLTQVRVSDFISAASLVCHAVFCGDECTARPFQFRRQG